MARNAIGIVYRKEFTEWVRDRRTLISTVLVPLFFFPIIMVGFTALAVVMVGKAKEETPKIMILDGEDSPQVVAGLRRSKVWKSLHTARIGRSKFPIRRFGRRWRSHPDFRRRWKKASQRRSRFITTKER